MCVSLGACVAYSSPDLKCWSATGGVPGLSRQPALMNTCTHKWWSHATTKHCYSRRKSESFKNVNRQQKFNAYVHVAGTALQRRTYINNFTITWLLPASSFYHMTYQIRQSSFSSLKWSSSLSAHSTSPHSTLTTRFTSAPALPCWGVSCVRLVEEWRRDRKSDMTRRQPSTTASRGDSRTISPSSTCSSVGGTTWG